MEGKTWQEIADVVGVNREKVYAYAKKYWPPREAAQEENDMHKQIPEEPTAPIDTPIETYESDPAAKAELPTVAAPAPKPANKLDLLQIAIGNLSGVDAYLTGHAIACLINWQFVDDLREARDAIDMLIQRAKA